MIIRIKHNNEMYEITQESQGFVWDVACADYDSSIEQHVQNICEALKLAGVEVVLEGL